MILGYVLPMLLCFCFIVFHFQSDKKYRSFLGILFSLVIVLVSMIPLINIGLLVLFFVLAAKELDV